MDRILLCKNRKASPSSSCGGKNMKRLVIELVGEDGDVVDFTDFVQGVALIPELLSILRLLANEMSKQIVEQELREMRNETTH
jgi:hypothetical protein